MGVSHASALRLNYSKYTTSKKMDQSQLADLIMEQMFSPILILDQNNHHPKKGDRKEYTQ